MGCQRCQPVSAPGPDKAVIMMAGVVCCPHSLQVVECWSAGCLNYKTALSIVLSHIAPPVEPAIKAA